MKANTVLFTHIKSLMPVLKTTSPTINKAFYELLKLYAVYLNANETNLDQSYGLLRAFATSPSPYILLAEAKVYTAVIDLDGTLLISSRREG